MKKIINLFLAAVFALTAGTALGLADSSAPTKIQIPFANSAGGAYVRTVPVASQIGIQNGAASYTDGFPPLNFVPVNAGGVPPFGQDMNGVLRDVSAHARWWAAGGPVYYDSAYQTAIGGYPKGAIVQSATVTGKLWFSSTENNVTNPDTGGAGWAPALNTVYAPLTGTGASGTWGINITGNAATANNATSATNATYATSSLNAFSATVNGQTSYANAGLQSISTSGDVHIALHASGTSATSIKHTRGGAGISVVGVDGSTLAPITASTFTGALVGNAATATNATTATTATNVTGSAVVSGAISSSSPSSGIGYATGAGGVVTQLTSKSTPVTINKICGAIITASDNLAAGGQVVFAVNNSMFAVNDVVVVNITDGNGNNYTVAPHSTQSSGGIFYISIKNVTGAPLAQAVRIQFAIIKSVTA